MKLLCLRKYNCLYMSHVLSVSRQIARLQASFDKSVAEKEELTHNIEQTQGRLTRAGKLTTGLADEQIRWAESVKVWSDEGGRGLIIIFIIVVLV